MEQPLPATHCSFASGCSGKIDLVAAKPIVAQDVRFTAGRDLLNAFFLEWPAGEASIKSLGRASLPDAAIDQVRFADGTSLRFRRDADGLHVRLPDPPDRDFAQGLQIYGRGLL